MCVESCPDEALFMEEFETVKKSTAPEQWEYCYNLPHPQNPLEKFTVKGSQFEKPLLEFSGACSGCGETSYVKLLSQLYGDRLVTANSSGCSSVWSGVAGYSPFAVNDEGQGPAWGRSLFEDTAEYAYGMRVATDKRRQQLRLDMKEAIAKIALSPPVMDLF